MSAVGDVNRAFQGHNKVGQPSSPLPIGDKAESGHSVGGHRDVSIKSESPNSLEEAGLRGQREDEDEDHEHEPRMTLRRFLSLLSLAFMWTSAQIPLYLFGSIPPIIYGDIGGVSYWIWLVTGNLLGSAAICPFVGNLSDLMGRRYVAIAGSLVIIVGQIVCGLASSMGIFILGMVVSGVGAGVNELTALAGTSELAPTKKRGLYVALLISTIIPFLPSVMWAQLIAVHNWRYVALLSGSWTAVGLVLAVLFYHPPPRANSLGMSRREMLSRIDYLGGFLSIAGIVLFTAGVLSGGYQYDWSDSRVLGPLIVGIALMVGFVVWEAVGAKYPMFPRRLGKAPRTLVLTLVITFISGANFFSVILLWPNAAYNIYGHDAVGVGIRGLPFAFGVMAGCVLFLVGIAVVRGRIRWLLFGASCIMTAGCGALAAATPTNIHLVYFVLFLAGVGVGGIVVPASIITTIICPDDLIATITALTLAIRVVGGAVGYAVYYNVFAAKLVPNATALLAAVCVENGITSPAVLQAVVGLTLESLLPPIRSLPGVTDAAFARIVAAGQEAYAMSYPWVYYCSIAFGGVAVLASLFLEDIGQFLDDHVAVVIA